MSYSSQADQIIGRDRARGSDPVESPTLTELAASAIE